MKVDNEATTLTLSLLQANGDDLRTTPALEDADAELRASILAHGLLEPLVVRGREGQWFVIAGHRRLPRAARPGRGRRDRRRLRGELHRPARRRGRDRGRSRRERGARGHAPGRPGRHVRAARRRRRDPRGNRAPLRHESAHGAQAAAPGQAGAGHPGEVSQRADPRGRRRRLRDHGQP